MHSIQQESNSEEWDKSELHFASVQRCSFKLSEDSIVRGDLEENPDSVEDDSERINPSDVEEGLIIRCDGETPGSCPEHELS